MGGLIGHIESQVVGGVSCCDPPDAKALFSLYVAQNSPKSTFRCNLKHFN